jgi:acyl phosphate:glycerol-3-phosphate acyltransferase
MTVPQLVSLIFAYFIGSIPVGFLVVKLAGGDDIRDTGSGGTGATNVMRKAGTPAGLLTLILDALKGAAAVIVTQYLTDEHSVTWTVAIAGVLAVIGHCFPVWLKFKAGKGVATGLGVFLALAPWAVLPAILVFVVIVWLTRFVSLGSIAAAAFIPLWSLGVHLFVQSIPGFFPLFVSLCLASAIIIFKHSENIKRLLAGTENKFGKTV